MPEASKKNQNEIKKLVKTEQSISQKLTALTTTKKEFKKNYKYKPVLFWEATLKGLKLEGLKPQRVNEKVIKPIMKESNIYISMI